MDPHVSQRQLVIRARVLTVIQALVHSEVAINLTNSYQ